MTVYLDQVWLLNTLLDYLLFVSTAQLCGCHIQRLRFLAVATLGGSYAAAGFVWSYLHLPIVRAVVGIMLGCLAFYKERKMWRSVAMFLLLSAALAGSIMAFGIARSEISWGILLLSSGVFYLLLEIVLRQSARYGYQETELVCVYLNGKRAQLRALHDTGNTLRSPITGAAVLVAEIAALCDLWSKEEEQILIQDIPAQEKVAKLYRLGSSRFSLLPYTAVSGSGLLLCMRSDAVQIGRRRYRHTPVALVTHTLGTNYSALWGGEQTHEIAQAHSVVDTVQAG